MAEPPTDPERLRRLTCFLPKFRRYSDSEKEFAEAMDEDSFLAVQYPEFFSAFLDRLQEDRWLGCSYSPDEGTRYMENTGLLEDADLRTLRRLLVFCSRGERFCTGFWARAVESGFLPQILRRMKSIQQDLQEQSA